jgi:hypothetical protein
MYFVLRLHRHRIHALIPSGKAIRTTDKRAENGHGRLWALKIRDKINIRKIRSKLYAKVSFSLGRKRKIMESI